MHYALHSTKRFDLRRKRPLTTSKGAIPMKMSSAIRVALAALTAFAGATLSSAFHADAYTLSLTIYKAGGIVAGPRGGGQLHVRASRYGLSTGGQDSGPVFGGPKTVRDRRV